MGGEPRISGWFVGCAGHASGWGLGAHELRESVAAGVAALAGALHEARSAQRLAGARAATAVSSAALSVVASDEVASHELLLPAAHPA